MVLEGAGGGQKIPKHCPHGLWTVPFQYSVSVNQVGNFVKSLLNYSQFSEKVKFHKLNSLQTSFIEYGMVTAPIVGKFYLAKLIWGGVFTPGPLEMTWKLRCLWMTPYIKKVFVWIAWETLEWNGEFDFCVWIRGHP